MTPLVFRPPFLLCSVFALLLPVPASAETGADAPGARSADCCIHESDTTRAFPLSSVRLLEGPFLRAQELNRGYLLALDTERLLAPFRSEAGLPARAPKYPNWESSGLDGHTAGHYLSAVAQLWAVTRDPELLRRLEAMVDGLAECQRAGGDGYVGGIPRGRQVWSSLPGLQPQADSFSLQGAWVPWYNEHKLFAGLRDAWLLAGNTGARDVLVRLSDWCATLLAQLDEAQMQAMLKTEHGGMNEVLADVAAITGDEKYLALARRFSHRALLEPLLRHEDRLTGLHANTQIPKVVGFARIAELGGDASWREASRFFWDNVVTQRSLAFGGNSVGEHFNPPADFTTVLQSREGPETCNSYNMLRLTEVLFRHEPAARYADFYERTLFNHILSSQHPGHGGFVYFTPIRPRHYRVYSQPETCFWCCVGSGLESHGKYGAFIYAHSADTLYVNLFMASELSWPEQGLRLRQETSFPDRDSTLLTLQLDKPRRFTLRLRHPGWCAAPSLRINGEPVTLSSSPASYASLTREWRDGDRVEFSTPMTTRMERLPDGSDHVALLHGPIVLAAATGTEQLDGLVAGDSRMGHVAPGPQLPMDAAPMLVGQAEAVVAGIRPVPGKPFTFSLGESVRPAGARDLELVPFFRVHDTRYMMYWRLVAPGDYAGVVAGLEAAERERLELETRTVDQVSPGEQQPEVEHGLRTDRSDTGHLLGRHSRDAAGSFSYQLRVEPGRKQSLVVTLFSREWGRAHEVRVNDRVLATHRSAHDARETFVDTEIPLPDDLLAAAPDGRITVSFVALSGARTAHVYGLRVVRAKTAP